MPRPGEDTGGACGTAVIDVHVHLVSEDAAAYPHAEQPPFATERYVHPVGEYLHAMAAAGVAGAVAVQPFGIYGTDNGYQADAAASHPARLVAVGGVAASGEGARQLSYWVRERGMAGGRVITLGQGTRLTDPGLHEVCRAAQELDVPLCLLTSRRHLADLPVLAAAHPQLRIVLDHLGVSGAIPAAEEVIDRLRALVAVDNVFLKVSTPLLASGERGRRVLEFVLAEAGAARVLWGSNYPVTDLGGYRSTVEVSRAALEFLPASDRAQVLGGTALSLWPGLAPAADAVRT